MKEIRELSDAERKQIEDCLEAEGYTKISFDGLYLNFSKKMRNYRLASTDPSLDDLGLSVDFDYEEFMSRQHDEKTRHTVSLKDAIEKKGSIEDACKYLGWDIVKEKHLHRKDSEWIAELHIDFIYEVDIGEHVHIIVNELNEDQESGVKVYAGGMDALWRMGSTSVTELFSGSNLFKVLKSL